MVIPSGMFSIAKALIGQTNTLNGIISAPTGIQTGNFSVVVFLQAPGAQLTTGFTTSDVSIGQVIGASPATAGLTDFTVRRQSHNGYLVSFTPSSGRIGTFSMSLSGTVRVGSQTYTLTSNTVNIRFNTLIPSAAWRNVANNITTTSETRLADLRFNSNVQLRAADIRENNFPDNISWRIVAVVNGREIRPVLTSHYSYYRIKARIGANQNGSLSLTLLRNSVTNIGGNTGPASDATSPSITYDTRPPVVLAPNTPTGLAVAATSSRGQLRVTWTEVSPTPTSYTVRWRRQGTTFYSVRTGISRNASSYTITGLLDSTTYDVSVAAVGPGGTSTFTSNKQGRTLTPVAPTPGTVRSLTAISVSRGSFDVGWEAPSSGTPTGYQYRYGTSTSNYGSWVNNGSTRSARVTGLSDNTLYYIQVRAYNTVSTSTTYGSPSSTTVRTPSAPPEVVIPNAPTSFTLTASRARVDMSWTAPTNVAPDGYQYRLKVGTGSYSAWRDVGNVTSYRVTGLRDNTLYTGQVRAFVIVGGSRRYGSPSNEDSDTTPAARLPAPSAAWRNVRSDPITDSAETTVADLLFDQQVNLFVFRDDITVLRSPTNVSWLVYRVGTDGVETPHTSPSTFAAHYRIKAVVNLNQNGTFAFQLKARTVANSQGTAGPISIAQSPSIPYDTRPAVVAPAKVTGVTATAQFRGALRVRWTQVTGAAGYQVQWKLTAATDYGNWQDTDSATSTLISALLDSTSYNVRVRAYRERDSIRTYGPESDAATGTTADPPPQAPAAPTGLVVATGRRGELNVNWTESSSSNVTYEYHYRRTGTSDVWTTLTTSATKIVISGLLDNQSYDVQVRSVGSTGLTSEWTDVVTGTTLPAPVTAPNAPTGLTLGEEGRGGLRARWTSSTTTGVRGYQIRWRTELSNTYGAWTDTDGSNTHLISALRDNTTYYAQVRAYIISGGTRIYSGPSNTATGTTQDPAPPPVEVQPPTNFMASTASVRNAIDLSWTASVTPNVLYEIHYRLSSVTAWQNSTTVRGSFTSTQITGLRDNTEYTFRIKARAGEESSAWSPNRSASTQGLPVADPSNLKATTGEAFGEIDLTWDASATASVTYEVRRKLTSSSSWGEWTNLFDTRPSGTVTGLSDGVSYDFQVRARKGGSVSGATSTATATTLSLSVPTNLKAVTGSNRGEIDLTWNAVNLPGSEYQVRWRVENGSYGDWSSDIDALKYTITGLEDDTVYDAQVRARLGTRTTAPSSSASARTREAMPPPPPIEFGRVGNLSDFGITERGWSPGGLTEIDGNLYMAADKALGFSSQARLYFLNKETGAATLISDLPTSGHSFAQSITYNTTDNRFYMAVFAGNTPALYRSVPITTPPTTRTSIRFRRVGRATNFGNNEDRPAGLAFIGNTLYMIGWENAWLTTVSITTGVATRVGNVERFGLGRDDTLHAEAGLANINGVLYMLTTRRLYTLDTGTGVATLVPANFNIVDDDGESQLGDARGVIGVGSNIFIVDRRTDALYRSPPPPPATVNPPTNLRATTGDQQGEIDLAWTASTTENAKYQVRFKKTADTNYGDWAGDISTTSHVQTGLDAGTSYDFQVRAFISTTFSTPSAPSTASTLAAPTVTTIAAVLTGPTGVQRAQYQVDIVLPEDVTGFDLNDIDYGLAPAELLGSGDTYRLLITPIPDSSGTHTITIASGARAFDSDMTEVTVTGNTITVQYDTRPIVAAPVWTAIPLTRLSPGQTRNISVDNHLSGQVNTVTLRNNPDWVSVTGSGINSTIVISPPDDGTFDETENFSMSAIATGNGGTAEEDFDVLVEVAEVTDAPVWSIINTIIMRPGGLETLSITDYLTNADSVDISGNPDWVRLLSGVGINRQVRIAPPDTIDVLTTVNATLIATKGTEVRTNPMTIVVIPKAVEVIEGPRVESWDVDRGNRFNLPMTFTAHFTEPIANTDAELRASSEVEGVDIDKTDASVYAVAKADDNMSATWTIRTPEDFVGTVSVGIEEDDLRPIEE